MASALSAPHFHNEEAAFAYVEACIGQKAPSARTVAALTALVKWGANQPAPACINATSAASPLPCVSAPSLKAAMLPCISGFRRCI